MTKRGFARLPGRGDARRTEQAERLLASQSTFSGGRAARDHTAAPGTGDTSANKSGGETRQASLSRRAGPAPAIGPLPATSRSRFAADLLTILSSERKAQNHGATVTGPWNTQAQCLGAFIRNRRKLARLTLRQLAETTSLSNAYLSQLERGLHLPSVRVLKLLSEALNVSA
jgi:Helix-turn-helix